MLLGLLTPVHVTQHKNYFVIQRNSILRYKHTFSSLQLPAYDVRISKRNLFLSTLIL
jgi:hypothetical protein